MKSENKENGRPFYEEMDRHKKRKKDRTLSLGYLTIFFIVLIAVSELILFSFGRAFRSRPESKFSVKGIVDQSSNLISTTDFEGQKQTTITQGAFCSKVTKAIKEEVACAIDDQGIKISGKISPLLPKNASVYLSAKVQDKKLIFQVTKLSIGEILIPKFVAGPIPQAISKATSETMPEGYITRVDFEPAVMVVWTTAK